MRVLVLIHDAFGGRGGIAKFNRDLLTALASAPGVTEVVALPRYIVEPVGTVPENLQYDEAASHGKLAYLSRLIRTCCQATGSILLCAGI